MMAGRLGQYLTLNSQDILDIPVKTNERLRLRIINAANSRIFQLRIDRHTARVMAVDGQPCPADVARNGVCAGTRHAGRPVPRRHPRARRQGADRGRRSARRLAASRHAWSTTRARRRGLPRCAEPAPLPANPLPAKLDLANAFPLDVPLDGGGMADDDGARPRAFHRLGVPPQQRIWALAGVAATGHDGPPMFTVPRGRTVVLNYINRTAFPHAMHVHGHHFRAFDSAAKASSPIGSTP